MDRPAAVLFIREFTTNREMRLEEFYNYRNFNHLRRSRFRSESGKNRPIRWELEEYSIFPAEWALERLRRPQYSNKLPAINPFNELGL